MSEADEIAATLVRYVPPGLASGDEYRALVRQLIMKDESTQVIDNVALSLERLMRAR